MSGALRSTRVPSLPRSPLSPDKRIARLQAEESASAVSRGSSHWGGDQFWSALRNTGLEREVSDEAQQPASCCFAVEARVRKAVMGTKHR